ncbi:TauD/TfdA family dioxygenase [Nisaea acidiphila]|uniref:TauD/TfdA family dioxygenase n=1 Tax=Nisaea acidiphila TaxID=1862145 RepID=A0A9J7AV98_9PROT|nr:TauD/TfdA family dioxygenase [Nisaea acidiphila]UUX51038.1 TauD/TfdA family dioxygenase [Nisaea acidiphila]
MAQSRKAESKLDIRPLAGALGAEIHGLDISQNLDGASVAALRQALLDHLVIFLPAQELTPQRQLAFAQHFGEPVKYPFVKGLEDCPEVMQILKTETDQVNFGGVWHSDTSYKDHPPMGTMLYAVELPPFGGDTMFANQYLAFEALSDGMKALLSDLKAINVSGKDRVQQTRSGMIQRAPVGQTPDELSACHPVVRTHPETGRKSLYVNIAHTTRFDGMTEEESAPLLNFLFQHQIQPEFTCRFRWSPGALAFWDNRAAMHYPINDYHGYRRAMNRVTLAGDRPF